MMDYTLNGGCGQCPKCGHPRFSGPAEVRLSDIVICRDCGERVTVRDAINAGLKAAGLEELGPEESLK
jgi:hypothetical protein